MTRIIVRVTPGGGLQQTIEPITVRAVSPLRSVSTAQLTDLTDVDTTNQVDGSVLQYDEDTNSYKVQPLVLDGGTF